MSIAFEHAARSPSNRRAGRSPAVAIAGIAALGILTDRLIALPLDLWILLAAVFAFSWTICSLVASRSADGGYAGTVPRSRFRVRGISVGTVSTVCLVIGWFAIAGAWHHWRWNCRSFDEIGNSATDEPQLVQITGKVTQSPWVLHDTDPDLPSWRNPDRSFVVIECRSLAHVSGQPLLVSGLIRASMDGALTGIAIGDLVTIHGDLIRPATQSNPGEFDQRAFLRGLGISALVRSKSVEAIQVVGRERSAWDWVKVVRGWARSRAERILTESLGENSPVAQAMLLGTRVQIDEETRRDFRESGLLHILAISGMNVGLLWSCLWAVSRWMGASARMSIWIVIICLPLYAFVTDANPPIVRATIIALIVAFGQFIGRRGSLINSLALAALCVLIWNPSDLFNPGAQLSFLAVLAIHHATMWLSLLRQRKANLEEEQVSTDPAWVIAGKRFGRAVLDANLIGLAVWLMTTPLIAREFHLISPIGSLLTVLLIVPLTFLFWVGYSYLILGFVWQAGFAWLGALFNLCLTWFLGVVHFGASVRWGHAYVPSPPLWWIVIFYAVTTLPLLVTSRPKWGTAVSVRGGLSWLVMGLIWGMMAVPDRGLTCTFTSVGHGLSVLIECPNGRTLLYDAGGMIGGTRVAQTISQTLWESGRAHLDAVIVSHADGDHCNALPQLARIVSPKGLLVHRSFLDWNQPAVVSAINSTSIDGARIQLISEGQSIDIDPSVRFEVLHPPHEFRSPRDNPNSVVLLVEYAGRRILLTGDLELDGLEHLLRSPRQDVDILLSPHHGSLNANPPDLARWATPEYLIVSTPEAPTADRLRVRYGPETQILATARFGAIRCRVTPDGELNVIPFKVNVRQTRE